MCYAHSNKYFFEVNKISQIIFAFLFLVLNQMRLTGEERTGEPWHPPPELIRAAEKINYTILFVFRSLAELAYIALLLRYIRRHICLPVIG